MAKIYETKEDFERDRLEKDMKALRHESTYKYGTGLGFFINSFVVAFANVMREKSSNWLYGLSGAMAAMAGMEWYGAFSAKNKARDLETQREQLGPEQVVLPPGVGDTNCNCPQKPYSQTIEPKTLMEQAAKPESGLARE